MAILKKTGIGILLVLVSISTAFNAPVLSTLVLCLGQDGHFELEYSLNGKCGSSTQAEEEGALHASEAESHCGTCTDVALLHTFEEAHRRSLQESPAPHLLCMAARTARPPFHMDRMASSLLSLPPPSDRPLLAHLRTVRLLV